MLRVLFLDDEVYRHDGACTNKHSVELDKTVEFTICIHKKAVVYHVWHAMTAISCLRTCNPFDVVFLDHDLGFGHGKADNEVLSGWNVVLILCDLPEDKRPKKVVVHSYNTVAAPKMVAKLKEHGYDVIWETFHPLHFHLAE
jgi:predicted P-loop ATPase/GTPase